MGTAAVPGHARPAGRPSGRTATARLGQQPFCGFLLHHEDELAGLRPFADQFLDHRGRDVVRQIGQDDRLPGPVRFQPAEVDGLGVGFDNLAARRVPSTCWSGAIRRGSISTATSLPARWLKGRDSAPRPARSRSQGPAC